MSFYLFLMLFLLMGCGNGIDPNSGSSLFCEGDPCLEVRQSFRVAEGDIILSENGQEMAVDESLGAIRTRKQSQLWLWPSGQIPYEIDPRLSNPARIHEAIKHYEERTAIRFVPRTTHTSYVVFEPGVDNCMSYIGRTGSRQPVVLAEGCTVPNVIHEIGHVLGYYHEQSRPDRDRYVSILWQNVAVGREDNFKSKLYDTTTYGPYDFTSIMHYQADAFSKNGQPTIRRRNGSTAPIGNNVGLSSGDIAAINSVYGNLSLP